jgi:hypothetical protein
MNSPAKTKKARSRAWMGYWGFALVMPFLTTWFYCSSLLENGGLSSHPEFPLPIFVMTSLAVVVAVCAVLFSGLKWWAKCALCLVSVGLQVMLTGLGALIDIYLHGFGNGG